MRHHQIIRVSCIVIVSFVSGMLFGPLPPPPPAYASPPPAAGLDDVVPVGMTLQLAIFLDRKTGNIWYYDLDKGTAAYAGTLETLGKPLAKRSASSQPTIGSASTDSSQGSRTVDAMRNIAIGIASYLGTSGKYPRASNINELCAELTRAQTVAAPKGSVEVRHLKTCSTVDEWGTAFRYHHFLKGSPLSATASDHEGFRLVSAGADKRFAPSIDLAAPQGSSGLQVKGANRSTNEDIVLQEGMFLTWPPGQKPEIVQMFDD